MDFYIAIGCLFLAIGVMTWLMFHNLKILRETKEERIAARRAEKRIKNERLRKAFKLPKNPNN